MKQWFHRAGVALVITASIAAFWSQSVTAQRPAAAPAASGTVDPSLFAGLSYRNLTNFSRGGRSHTIVGVPSQAGVFYMGAANGGVFKSTDNGGTWVPVTDGQINVGSTGSLAVADSNPDIVWLGTGSPDPRGNISNGDGVYKSIDAGATWKRLTKGLPSGDLGRIGLDIYAADPKVVFATVEAKDGGVFRTSDAGETWEKLATLNTRPSYYSQIRVDPKDKNRVYTLGSNRGFYVSNDAGKTFVDTGVSGVHGEDHALWIDPDNTHHLIIGGDGGVSISWDRGATWDFRMNMPIGQFYEIDADNSVPFIVCGGLQDNGEWCVPSAVRDRNGISAGDAWNIGGGDGFYVKFDRADENFAYAESQNGNVSRVNLKTMERTPVRPAKISASSR